jgi:hypothetical protein
MKEILSKSNAYFLKSCFSKVAASFPPFIKIFFKNTKEYKRRKVKELYESLDPIYNDSKSILFWVPGGMPLMLHVEGSIAAALKLRGIDVHAILCDGPFNACIRREITNGISVENWSKACTKCKTDTSAVLDNIGIPYSFIGDFVPESLRIKIWENSNSMTWDNLDKLFYRDINVGGNARSSILRYLQGFELNGNEEIVREYTYSALTSAAAAANAIDRVSPSHIFMSHGIYVDWGPALQTALSRGISVTGWMSSYLKARFYFRHIEDGTRIDPHNMNDRTWKACERSTFSVTQSQRLDFFLKDRYRKHVSFDMKTLPEYMGDNKKLQEKYAQHSDNPIWGIIAHINWDCASDFSPMAYMNFDDWLIETINEISTIQDINWLIKIHPAESWDNPASGVHNLINRHFSVLPSHVKVIPADEKISPLEFFQQIDGGVTVYGTSGLELALMGKPVILAGEAHYGAKGFTYDGFTFDAYKELLHKAPLMKPLSEKQHLMARKYAYCYFIQRQVPLPIVNDKNSLWWKLQYDKLQMLLPGQNKFVDFICDKIIGGEEFIMDDDLVSMIRNYN